MPNPLTNNGLHAQQLGITYFKNFWTSFRIIKGTDKRESDKRDSTVDVRVSSHLKEELA